MRNPTISVQAGLIALYSDFRQRDRGGWREVGQLLDISGAYARQLAEGTRPITPKIARRYLALNLTPAQTPARRTPYGALSLRRTTLDRLAQHRTGRTADALINALLDKWEQEPQP